MEELKTFLLLTKRRNTHFPIINIPDLGPEGPPKQRVAQSPGAPALNARVWPQVSSGGPALEKQQEHIHDQSAESP